MRKVGLALVLLTLAACPQTPSPAAGADSEPLPRYSEEGPGEITVYTHDRVFYRYTDHKYNVVCYRYLADEMLVCLPLLGPTE